MDIYLLPTDLSCYLRPFQAHLVTRMPVRSAYVLYNSAAEADPEPAESFKVHEQEVCCVVIQNHRGDSIQTVSCRYTEDAAFSGGCQ
jgi:hypothetical protein